MGRAFRYRNFGVYILPEQGQRHHLPHAHIKDRRRRVASVYLLTMTFYDDREPLPDDLVAKIREEQAALLALWEKLNEPE